MVATTYSLDLTALLLAPLSFALSDHRVDDGGNADPIAVLDALRRYAALRGARTRDWVADQR